jgi:caffeoyl-CoA O-methyltransferase
MVDRYTMDLIFDYCAAHTTSPSSVLNDLERATYLRTLSPHMLSGAYQGRLLTLFSQMMRPQRILEIGTFTGYAAICLAEGLPEGGVLHTIEVNDELVPIIRQYIEQAGMSQKIHLHIGDAAQIIPTLDEVFDLVFLDAGKLDYPIHYELAMSKTRSGGVILADNVLWTNRVPDLNDKEQTVELLRNFNDQIHNDPRVDNLLLEVRDGLMMIRKK